jgi:hypothetical protein
MLDVYWPIADKLNDRGNKVIGIAHQVRECLSKIDVLQ